MDNQIWFGNRNSLTAYGLELIRCTLTPAVRKQRWVDVPGGDGSVELMAPAGLIAYENRTLRAELRCVTGRLGNVLDRLTHDLEGNTVKIILPGSPMRYVEGVCHVNSAHRGGKSVTVSAVCGPWRYSCHLSTARQPASPEGITFRWANGGSKPVIPELTVGEGGTDLTWNDEIIHLDEGRHLDPRLVIPAHSFITGYTMGGTVTAQWREAIL
ncbi:MAG: hypothetical protein IJ960_00920 [Oscillospiraceae bacterium]|nr:hypothetical protein [Oscillospiraceae bacterium]